MKKNVCDDVYALANWSVKLGAGRLYLQNTNLLVPVKNIFAHVLLPERQLARIQTHSTAFTVI